MIWNRAYDVIGDDTQAAAVRVASDNPNHFVTVGSTGVVGGNRSVFVMRTDGAGNPVWTFTYGEDPSRNFNRKLQIQNVDPGGYIVCGTTFQSPVGYVGFLLRIDNAGTLQWMRFYPLAGMGFQDVEFNDVQQTSTGFVVTGHAQSQFAPGPFQNSRDTIVMTTDTAGNPIWAMQYHNIEGNNSGESIVLTPTGYAVVGRHLPALLDAVSAELFVVDTAGTLGWYNRVQQFTKGTHHFQNQVANGTIRAEANGDLTMVGGYNSDAALMRFTGAGAFSAGQTYGVPSWQFGTSFLTDPTGHLFVGLTSNGLDIDYYIVRTDSSFTSGCNEIPFTPVVDQPPIVPVELTFQPTETTVAVPRVPFNVNLSWTPTILCSEGICFDPIPLVCTATAVDVTIEWGPLPGTAETVELRRDGTVIATPTLADTAYTDLDPPAGPHVYELIVTAIDPACEPGGSSCSVHVPIGGPFVEQLTDVIFRPARPTLDGPIVCLEQELAARGRTPRIVTSFADISPQLASAHPDVTPIVWLSLGEFPAQHELTQEESAVLVTFLESGGSLYLEGSDVAFAPPTALSGIDGVIATDDGAFDGDVPALTGLDSGLGLDATPYSADYTASGRSIDHLSPDGPGSAAIFQNAGGAGQITGVYHDATAAGGTHRVITSSTLLEGYAGDLAGLLGEFLNALSPAASAGTPFIRGECNGDGSFDIADMIYLLNHLFIGGGEGPCHVACDINGSQTLDIADVIYGLNYLLVGGQQPPAPFPGCGLDAVGEALFGCTASGSCP